MKLDYPSLPVSEVARSFSEVARNVDRGQSPRVLVTSNYRLTVAIVSIQDVLVLEWVQSILDGDSAVPIRKNDFAYAVQSARDSWTDEASDLDQGKRKREARLAQLPFVTKGSRSLL